MKQDRIQKIMAEAGICSRRAAEIMIKAGRVKINGHPVQLGDKMDSGKDLLQVDGKNVLLPKKREYIYLMLYKPRGYVATAKDEMGRKTVMELLADIEDRIYPIGRLDKDSEGLLLFTNDGDFANSIAHPSHGVSKLYRVTVRPHATEEQISQLASGVTLDDGGKTQPASVRVVTDEGDRTVMEMTIREGKNRQIRRMCEAVGLEVSRLRRSAVGPVKLGMLQPGQYRDLTQAEINALRASASKAARTGKQSGSRAEIQVPNPPQKSTNAKVLPRGAKAGGQAKTDRSSGAGRPPREASRATLVGGRSRSKPVGGSAGQRRAPAPKSKKS